MGSAFQTQLALNIALLLQLVGLMFAVLSDPYIRKKHRRILLMAITAVCTLVVQNQLEKNLIGTQSGGYALSDAALTLIAVYGYCIRPVVIVLFMRIISEDRRPWIVAAANVMVNVTAFFSGLAFTIVDGRFYRGPLGYTTHVAGALLLIWDVYLSYKYRQKKKGAVFPMLIAFLLLAATAVDTWALIEYNISLLTVTIVSSCMFYYIWLHLEFARAHENALMAEQRIEIMLNQIQPHFLYNSLTAIMELCNIDPKRAASALGDFTEYLRHNMASLVTDKLIPFESEMDHVRHYINIQKMRFEDALTVVYDMEATNFRIPTLTVQPLMENAVTYGVRRNRHGRGTVILRTREFPDRYEVSVIDDGPGFEQEPLIGATRPHIGLSNVRERVRSVCGGDLRIDSEAGKGTAVTIILPKGG